MYHPLINKDLVLTECPEEELCGNDVMYSVLQLDQSCINRCDLTLDLIDLLQFVLDTALL